MADINDAADRLSATAHGWKSPTTDAVQRSGGNGHKPIGTLSLAGKYGDELTQQELAAALLSSLEAWERVDPDHRAETPKRFVSALTELTTREDFNFTTFPNDGNDEMITLGPIPFYTLCAHHIVPFFGNAWIGYVPEAKIAGLSKFARAVKWCAKGFWVQEDLTTEIATMIEDNLRPRGVAVVIKAEHMCMAMRGVGVSGVITTTSRMSGVFGDHNRTAKAEFLESIKGH